MMHGMMFVQRRRRANFKFEDRGVVLERSGQLLNMLVFDVESLADKQADSISVGLSVGSEEEFVENQLNVYLECGQNCNCYLEEEFLGNDLLVVSGQFVEEILQMANTVGA